MKYWINMIYLFNINLHQPFRKGRKMANKIKKNSKDGMETASRNLCQTYWLHKRISLFYRFCQATQKFPQRLQPRSKITISDYFFNSYQLHQGFLSRWTGPFLKHYSGWTLPFPLWPKWPSLLPEKKSMPLPLLKWTGTLSSFLKLIFKTGKDGVDSISWLLTALDKNSSNIVMSLTISAQWSPKRGLNAPWLGYHSFMMF